MRILEVIESETNTLQVEVEEVDLEIDPRAITEEEETWVWTFECTIIGNILTITRTDRKEGWNVKLLFRVYSPARETVPSFISTTYTYMGEVGERAPRDTLVGIIDSSAPVIRESAFSNCESMVSCTMNDNVTVIMAYAFMGCVSMKVLKLSRRIFTIGSRAFLDCRSIEALFFSPSLEDIGTYAFESCSKMRILSPLQGVQSVGPNVFQECDALFSIPRIRQYEYDDLLNTTNDLAVVTSICEVQQNMPYLHKVCLDPFITAQMIRDSLQVNANGGPCTSHDAIRTIQHNMTPLHIIVMNPHATLDVIMACFNLNKLAATESDDFGMTPMDYLRTYSNLEALTSLVEALCLHRS